MNGLGVTRSSTIHLMGRGALPALLWLCRQGFERVAIVSGSGAALAPADLLLCLDATNASLFAADLRRVRTGGLAILRTGHAPCAAVSRSLLHAAGFRIERRLRGVRRDVYIARRGERAISAPPAP